MILIPIDRINHTDVCPGNLGRRCACDREQLATGHKLITTGLVGAVVIILALLAQVLR